MFAAWWPSFTARASSVAAIPAVAPVTTIASVPAVAPVSAIAAVIAASHHGGWLVVKLFDPDSNEAQDVG
jgi:hypothetical protein